MKSFTLNKRKFMSLVLIFVLMAGILLQPFGLSGAYAEEGQPDLTVTDITAPQGATAGQQVTVTAAVYNRGDGDASGPFTVSLYADNEPIEDQTVTSAIGGQTQNVSSTWTPALPGSYILKVEADSGGDIEESDETNNELTITVEVSAVAAQWQTVGLPPELSGIINFIAAIWESPSGAIYVGFGTGSSGGILYKYAAGTWTNLNFDGANGSIRDIDGISDNEVYIVSSSSPRILLYDGTGYRDDIFNFTDKSMTSIKCFSSDSVYAVGNSGFICKLIDKTNGTWEEMVSSTTRNLRGIWGSSPTDIYAVGNNGTICHFNGSDWSSQTVGNQTLYGVWGIAADNVFACGNSGTMLHYDGTGWETMASGTTSRISGLEGTSDTDVYAFTDDGMLHYDGTEWEEFQIPVSTYITAIAIIGNGDIYAGNLDGDEIRLIKLEEPRQGTDLMVAGVQTPAGLAAGGDAQVMVTLKNKGEVDAPAGFKVKLYTESPAWQEEQTVTAAVYGGGTRDVSFTWPVPTGVNVVELRVLADSGNDITELNENNNGYSKTVTVSKLVLSTGVPGGHGSVTAAPPDGSYNYDDLVQLTAVSEEGYVFTGWGGDLSGGANPASVRMTGDKYITASFAPLAHDLELSAITAGRKPSGYEWNGLYQDMDAFQVTAGVRNNGNVIASHVLVNFYEGSLPIGTATIESINAGASANVTVPWTPSAPGSISLKASAVFTGTEQDVSPEDNEKTVSVTVRPSEVYPSVSMTAPMKTVSYDVATGTNVEIGPEIMGVIGFSPTEIFVATDTGIMNYTGSGSWNIMNGTATLTFNAIWGTSADDLYAVCFKASSGDGESSIYRYNGPVWTKVQGSEFNGLVMKVWASPGGKAYAITNKGLYCFEGGAWTQVSLPAGSEGHAPNIRDVWGTSEENIYVACGQGLLHYNGTAWSWEDTGEYKVFSHITGTSASDIYASSSYVLHYDGSSWTPLPQIAGIAVTDIAKSPSGALYAVAGERLFEYDGSGWKLCVIPPNEANTGATHGITGIYLPIADCMLIGGASGRLYYSGAALDIDSSDPSIINLPGTSGVTVSLRVEGFGGTIVPRTVITMDNFDLRPYITVKSGGTATPSSGWGPDRLTRPTVTHALVKVLQDNGIDCTDHTGGLDLQDYGWSLYASMINGEREFDRGVNSGWYYYVDGWLPSYGSQAYTLRGGEEIVWNYVQNYTDVTYAYITADTEAVAKDGSVKIGLEGKKADMNGTSDVTDIGGLTLYVNGREVAQEDSSFAYLGKGADGKHSIQFKEPGTYVISTNRALGVDIVRPTPIEINVYEPASVDTAPVVTVYGMSPSSNGILRVTQPTRSIMAEARDDREGAVTPIVKLNGTALETGINGSYLLEFTPGKNTITVDASDSAGNAAAAQHYTVYYNDPAASDTIKPEITVTGLSNNLNVTSSALSFTVAVVDNRDANVTPVVKLGNTVIASASNTDGVYSYTCILTSGDNAITVEATDTAGSKAEQSYTVKYAPPSDNGGDYEPPSNGTPPGGTPSGNTPQTSEKPDVQPDGRVILSQDNVKVDGGKATATVGTRTWMQSSRVRPGILRGLKRRPWKFSPRGRIP